MLFPSLSASLNIGHGFTEGGSKGLKPLTENYQGNVYSHFIAVLPPLFSALGLSATACYQMRNVAPGSTLDVVA